MKWQMKLGETRKKTYSEKKEWKEDGIKVRRLTIKNTIRKGKVFKNNKIMSGSDTRGRGMCVLV